MKKFMSLLLVGIMMLSLVACGKSGGGKGELNVGVFYYIHLQCTYRIRQRSYRSRHQVPELRRQQ